MICAGCRFDLSQSRFVNFMRTHDGSIAVCDVCYRKHRPRVVDEVIADINWTWVAVAAFAVFVFFTF